MSDYWIKRDPFLQGSNQKLKHVQHKYVLRARVTQGLDITIPRVPIWKKNLKNVFLTRREIFGFCLFYLIIMIFKINPPL